MKRFSTFAFIACMAMAASAQTQVMRIHAVDGAVTAILVDGIEYIDFDEITDTPVAEVVDLGGASNCFVVSEAGTYRFIPTHVDGSPVANIDHATWLWREKEGGELISDVSYTDGRISFTTNGQEGNAVIAAVDKTGTIVWIWHIWCTDQPVDKKMGDTTIMDRNLGAVSALEEDGRDTWGLVYQYGRNVPFYFIGDNQEYDPKEAMNQANKFTEINSEFNMKWSVSSSQRTEGYSLAESMANPMTHMMHKYVSGSNGGYHWAKDADVFELVWASDKSIAKTNYDPCPKGYKVPMSDQIDFTNITYEPNPTYDMLHPTPGFYIDDQWWPMNTGRHYEDGCALYGGQAKDYCDRLFLWTAYGGPYQLNFFTNYKFCPIRIIVENDYTKGNLRVTNPTAGTGAFGHAIRCVREDAAHVATPAVKAGQMAVDFTLTLADGTEKSLTKLASETLNTLLYFNNPDCPGCRDMKAAIEASPALQSHIADGSLRVVSVYTDDDAALWRQHVGDYPASWTVAIDAPQRVLTDGLYDMSTTPSLYLLDNEGHILLPDADLLSIEALLK